MSVAALPKYLGKQNLSTASPGMRFGMYLPIWRHNWEKEKNPDWRSICEVRNEKSLLEALKQRQQALASATPDVFFFPARSTAPFTTGLGNEHPLENGFAFLWPYGLPYLPGSGVKGVLRQAARELISGNWGESEWIDEPETEIKINNKTVPLTPLDLLFGLESKDGRQEHFRGVLNFWDVIPEFSGDQLMVEIMTAHQAHYYANDEQPHDSGSLTPISFLSVPPGSSFHFLVNCDLPRLQRLAPSLTEADRWQTLLQEAFEHAFDWLGFGAKTAVGYGAMEFDAGALAKQDEQQEMTNLSAEELQIRELLKQLDIDQKANNKQPGGPLNEQRLKLLEDALIWENEEYRVQAAEVIRKTLKFLPWSKKRKNDLNEKLSRLTGGS